MVMPTGADADRHLRLKVYLVVLAFAGAGIVLFWLGLGALLSLIDALSRENEVIALSPRSLLPLPLSITFLALAVLPFTRRDPVAGGGRRRAPAKKGVEPSSVVFAVAAVAVLATIAILPVSRLMVASIVTDRGYQSCPPPREWDRYAPYRWARSIEACP